MSCFPNDNGDGLRGHAACVPPPPTPTVRFEMPPVVVEIVTVPDFTPTEPGSNFTRTLRSEERRVGKEGIQSSTAQRANWNWGSSGLTPETAIGSVPSFVTVAV